MKKFLSCNTPLKYTDKESIVNFPSNDKGLRCLYDSLLTLLGKYISVNEETILFNQNNISQSNTMNCELILLRFSDIIENKLNSAQKVNIDVRWDNLGNYSVSGQNRDKVLKQSKRLKVANID